MSDPSKRPIEGEEDPFDRESAAELPSREAMSIIDPTIGMKMPDLAPTADIAGGSIDRYDE